MVKEALSTSQSSAKINFLKKYLLILFLSITSFAFGQNSRNDSLKVILENVFKADQEPRKELDSIQKKFSYNSPIAIKQWKLISQLDSANLKTVTSIIDKYGWLSAGETSEDANDALFLVIQHAPLPIQLKYLPTMKEAVKQGKAKPKDYAYLIDRTNIGIGKFQIYGSQGIGSSFYPIEDELDVNERRKSVGLEPIENYAKQTGLNYTQTKADLLKNKIVVMGTIFDLAQNGIDNATIYLGNNKLIGHTDKTGSFKIIIDQSFIGWAVIFRKPGFESIAISLDQGKKLFEVHNGLRKSSL